MPSPKASVIIPCYNHSRFLGQAIQSVLDQTFTDFEVIVVDDGSTDSTPQVGRRFDDRRVRYVWQENKGLPGARNTGIQASSGEYLAFLDADDWFLPRKLESQVRFLDEHPQTGIVCSGWIDTDEQGNALLEVRPWEWMPKLSLREGVVGLPLAVHCVLVRRCWLDAVGLFDESLGANEDQDLYLRLMVAGCQFVWMPEPVCRYRMHGNNMSRDASRMRTSLMAVLDKLYARPDLPEGVRAFQGPAYAAAHVSSAARAYGARALAEAQQDVSRAIELDPGLLQGNPCRLVTILVSWANSRMLGDEAEYLDTLVRHLPVQVPSVRRQVRKAIGNRYMGQVFEARRLGEWKTVLTCLVRALRLDPSWLFNRGVVFITVRTLVPVLRWKRSPNP